MKTPIPDMEWYINKSQSLGLLPRCPFAASNDCPRFYQSLALLGGAGCTKIDEKEDKRLIAKWKRHSLWPQTMEQATGISGTEKGPSSYHNFCPEVAYNNFKYFATFMARHADEIDAQLANDRLNREQAPSNDPRWDWSFCTGQHYSECPIYSPLAFANKQSSAKNAALQQSKETPANKNAKLKFTQTKQAKKASTNESRVVFISYAHADDKWRLRLECHLKPLLRGKAIDVWSDRRIKTSQRWHEEIQKSLAKASAAVLLVSPDFLASDYVENSELPVLLKGAGESGVRIFPVVISPCAFHEAKFVYMDSEGKSQTMSLSVFQAANPPSRTLTDMKRPERERALLKLAQDIADLGRSSCIATPRHQTG